jgi:hypothetical protein
MTMKHSNILGYIPKLLSQVESWKMLSLIPRLKDGQRHFFTKMAVAKENSRARICRPFEEPRNRFPAWRDGTATPFVVPARQATLPGEIDSSELIPGLHKRLQIRAQFR